MGIKTLKMRLEPNREQRDSIDDTIDYNRYVYNALITYCKLHYRRYSKLPSEFDLNYVCTRIRKNHRCLRIPSSLSHNDISKRVYQGCKRCLDDSMKEWKRKVGRKEIDPSEPMRISWPRYKSATRYKSYAINQAFEAVETRNAKGKKVRKLKLPKIKQPIRCYNQGTRLPGKPKVCIISRKDEGTYYSYWASIVCESEDDPKEHPEHPRAVGIDLGLRHLIATSDGQVEDNDHVYWNRLHQLKKESERFSESMHHTTEGRKRRNRLNHIYTKISNIRKNRIENITQGLVREYDTIVLEDLSITKLKQKSRSKRMTQSFSDASLGLMRNRLISKAECAGCEVVLVDPKGTSQTCSQCGTYVKKGLDVRVHECPVCGYTADRDVNAARNILYRGLAWQAGPGQRTNSPPF